MRQKVSISLKTRRETAAPFSTFSPVVLFFDEGQSVPLVSGNQIGHRMLREQGHSLKLDLGFLKHNFVHSFFLKCSVTINSTLLELECRTALGAFTFTATSKQLACIHQQGETGF